MKRALVISLSLFLFFTASAQNTVPDTGIADFPNYHPLIVHFPIILILVAAIMQIGNLFFTNKAYNYTIVAITVVGFISALLAATLLHAEPSRDLNATAKEIFEDHERFATITLWLSGIASLFKIAGLFTYRKWLEVGALVFLLGAGTAVSIAGHEGSALVYKQGVGPEGKKLMQEGEHE